MCCISESFNTIISHQLFDYLQNNLSEVTLHEHKLEGGFLLKNRF